MFRLGSKSKVTRKIIGISLLGLSSGIFASPLDKIYEYQPYLGFDVYQRHLEMVPGYGRDMFVKRIQQNNLYLGAQFNEYFGIEGGQVFTQDKAKTTLLAGDTIRFGRLLAAIFTTAENRIRLYGTHLNIVAQYPINSSKLHVMGSLGFMSLKVKAEYRPIGDELGILNAEDIEDQKRTFASRRVIPRFSGGLNYQFTDILAFRVLAGYETTAKFKNLVAKRANGESSPLRMSLKSNVLMGLGVTVKF